MKDPHEESRERLLQIERSIAAIKQYVKGKTQNIFCTTAILHDAVLLQFVIIGEAIVHVENDLLNKYDYPWYKVKSFRNMIAHEYFNIKLPAVWKIIEMELTPLEVLIKQILKNEF
ncbi:MAG: HepT-like ribonuclease domain-containing protein [Chitinophagaceae bacterium]